MPPFRFKPKIVPKNCIFCKSKIEPNLQEVDALKKYISERGKILAHTRTGICSKHQRRISRIIKYARFLALLPYVGK